jgi:hypothetical protein
MLLYASGNSGYFFDCVTRAKVPRAAVHSSGPLCCLQSRRHAQNAAQALWLCRCGSLLARCLRCLNSLKYLLEQSINAQQAAKKTACSARPSVTSPAHQNQTQQHQADSSPAPSSVADSSCKAHTECVRVNRATASAIPVPALLVDSPAPLHRQQLPAVAGTANGTEVSPLIKSFFLQAPQAQRTRADTTPRTNERAASTATHGKGCSRCSQHMTSPAAAILLVQRRRMLAELARWHANGDTSCSPAALPTSAKLSAVIATAGKREHKAQKQAAGTCAGTSCTQQLSCMPAAKCNTQYSIPHQKKEKEEPQAKQVHKCRLMPAACLQWPLSRR